MQNPTRIVIALLLIVAGSLAWYFDLFDYLSTERLQDAKDTFGIWAPVAFVVAFLVARHVLGDRFHQKLPKGFEKLNRGLHQSPFKAVVLIRLTTFLHPVVHWVLAASAIKLPQSLSYCGHSTSKSVKPA
ncbi:MAG: putative membrane protein YdjX (TVP38/TMEM64 family) [Patiriisocius sp.]|jgi:uncharacterized membrane protein YdjX (TVP38/TMEM64 family)